jgi:hypothetical protein
VLLQDTRAPKPIVLFNSLGIKLSSLGVIGKNTGQLFHTYISLRLRTLICILLSPSDSVTTILVHSSQIHFRISTYLMYFYSFCTIKFLPLLSMLTPIHHWFSRLVSGLVGVKWLTEGYRLECWYQQVQNVVPKVNLAFEYYNVWHVTYTPTPQCCIKYSRIDRNVKRAENA